MTYVVELSDGWWVMLSSGGGDEVYAGPFPSEDDAVLAEHRIWETDKPCRST